MLVLVSLLVVVVVSESSVIRGDELLLSGRETVSVWISLDSVETMFVIIVGHLPPVQK